MTLILSFTEYTVICSNDFKCTRRPLVPLGGICAQDRDCPRGVKCYNNICGALNAPCASNSTCAAGRECPGALRNVPDSRAQLDHFFGTVYCKNNWNCQVLPPQGPGSACLNDAGCSGGARCTRGVCGAVGGACASTDATPCLKDRERRLASDREFNDRSPPVFSHSRLPGKQVLDFDPGETRRGV
jgi:hypothetical protein